VRRPLGGGVGMGAGSWFDESTCRVVGDGCSTFFWKDNWVGGVPLRDRFRRLFDLALQREVSVEEMVRLGWEEGEERGCGGGVC